MNKPNFVPAGDQAETDRIRDVYRRRDRPDRASRRSGAMVDAYHRLAAERLRRTRAVIERLFPGHWPRLIDVGCGFGHDLQHWPKVGWPTGRLAGTDLIAERLEVARTECPDIEFRLSEGDHLPFDDNRFDVATAGTVFSSVLDASMRRALFAEMERIVRPGGALLIYDFIVRKPTNHDVVALPMSRLPELGRRPDASWRLSPLLYLVAAGAAVSPKLADAAMVLAPKTHRLSYWRISERGASQSEWNPSSSI